MSKSVREQLKDDFVDQYLFEAEFYTVIANSTKFELFPYPFDDGYIPTDKDIKDFKEECTKNKHVPVFSVNLGSYNLIFSPNSDKIGIELNGLQGFEC